MACNSGNIVHIGISHCIQHANISLKLQLSASPRLKVPDMQGIPTFSVY